MSFDPRSLERLRQLGRNLPQPLPPPAQPARPAPKLHPVETEQDPAQLFRELMGASADGTVPPHLLDRLRQLERPPASPAGAAADQGQQRQRQGPLRRQGQRLRRPAEEAAGDLYTAFEQLLLEEDDG